MTLILSTVNPVQAVVVADRRLTVGKEVVEVAGKEEGSNKGFVLICDDARVVVTFTGLAQFGSFMTREWLIDAIRKVKAPDHRIDGIVERLASEAEQNIEALALSDEDRRLSIAMAGYVYDADPPRGYLAHISNFEQLDSKALSAATGKFSVDRQQETRPLPEKSGAVLAIGDDRALADDDFQKLNRLVLERKSVSSITNFAVKAIRSANDRSIYVGRECMSAVVSPDPLAPVEGGFHPDGPVQKMHGFGSVDARSNSTGMVIDDVIMWAQEEDGSPVMVESRPRKQSRNAHCACGSGKKYKRCCGA